MPVQIHTRGEAESSLPQRIERKFFLTPPKITVAAAVLRHVCGIDPEYPAEQINSLYFDTADLDQHLKSLSGEFRKDKVRIRWYGRLEDHSGPQTVFIELKTRRGFASTKQRLKTTVAAGDLSPAGLARGIVPRHILDEALAGFGFFQPPGSLPLTPVIKISYWRNRFFDRFSGQRLALDSRIRSTLVISGAGYGERDLELPGGVIEIKGRSLEIPRSLRLMQWLDLDWSRFSKYSSCLEAHFESPGSLYRLSPSGINID